MNSTVRFAVCIVLLASTPHAAFAQSDTKWDRQIDLKPLVPPIVPPVIPRNSTLAPGSIGTTSPAPYSNGQFYDSAQTPPAPGIRLTIPSR